MKLRCFTIKDLLSPSFDGNYFMRLDVVINYLAIENYYGKNDYGWKMHDKWEKTSRINDPIESKSRFIELIKSFETDGDMTKIHPVKIGTMDGSLRVRDGAHRLACCIYFGYEKMYGYIKNPRRMKIVKRYKSMVDAGSRTLVKRGFAQDDLVVIKNKRDEILKRFGIC